MKAIALVVLHSLPGTARQEGALHFRFLEDRSHGEWFRASLALRGFIEMLKTASTIEIGRLFQAMRTGPVPRLRRAGWVGTEDSAVSS